jgi:ketosteroid isomerase-like protein
MKAKTSILLAGVFLVSLLSLVSGCVPKANDPAAVQAIQKGADDYVKAMNARDTDAAVAMMSDNMVYADINVPAMTGKAAVKKLHQYFFEPLSAVEFTMPVADVRVTGNLGVARGTWTAKLTPKSGLVPQTHDSGSWMAVLERQGDGSWQWQSLVANSDQPLPGSSPGGAEETILMEIEQDWANAFMKPDLPALDRILAKEWTNNFEGQAMSRAQALAEIKNGAYKLELFKISDLSAHVYGDVAIVTSTVTMKGKYKGTDAPSPQRSADIFVKRDGRWQAVMTYNTLIKP